MKTARWTLLASVVIAGVLTFGALGSGAGAAGRAPSTTSKGKGPADRLLSAWSRLRECVRGTRKVSSRR